MIFGIVFDYKGINNKYSYLNFAELFKKKQFMKTKISMLSIAVIAASTMIFTGCGTEDLSTPTIVLEGDSPMTVVLGGTYTDPGFSATDDEDGDISANVVVDDSEVNTDEIGEYEVSYTVTDEAGNTGTETRIVRVVVGKSNYLGTYQVHEVCDMDGDGIKGEAGVPYEINDYTVTVTAAAGANTLLFENFGAYGDIVVVPVDFLGDLDELLEVDDYNLPGTTIYFNADGEITTATTSAIEFTLDYTAEDTGVIIPCDATFEKL